MGTTVSARCENDFAPVHPHGRGDNAEHFRRAPGCLGSPPRAWGQHVWDEARRVARRFTPTGVGTTVCPVRSRTETYGSPPRAWGQRRHLFRSVGAARFTPTGVGTTPEANLLPPVNLGSPPRAWGQLTARAEIRSKARFTPTGVGTTPILSLNDPAAPVHPHGRGDNPVDGDAARRVEGSPPRAWGQRQDTRLVF